MTDDPAAENERIKAAYKLVSANTLSGRMGIKIVEASPRRRSWGRCRSTATPSPTDCCTAGRPACSPRPSGRSARPCTPASTGWWSAIEISATHHLGARDGEVTGVATLAHGGRTLVSYEIVITDEPGRRVCTSRLTCLLRDVVPGEGAPPAVRL